MVLTIDSTYLFEASTIVIIVATILLIALTKLIVARIDRIKLIICMKSQKCFYNDIEFYCGFNISQNFKFCGVH